MWNTVLQILVWYCAFSFMGTVRNIWLLAEGKQRLLPAINLTGAVFNVAFNAVMIPLWGACGAAFASLLTQVFTNFVLGFIIKPMRENNRLIIRGLDPRLFVRQLGAVAQMLLKRSGDSADL
jgi:Na+-driven multidrug efflux pump